MRERITFVHGAEAAFDPEQLKVDKEAVRVQALKASREDRLTFSISELPQEVLRRIAGLKQKLTLILLVIPRHETMSRVTRQMGVSGAVHFHLAICLEGLPRTERLLYAPKEPHGVCEHCPESSVHISKLK